MAKKAAGANLGASLPSPRQEPAEDPVDNYEVRRHLDTLTDAHAILNDPEKMAKVHKLAGRKQKALQGIKSVEDLKSVYKQKFGMGALAGGSDTAKDGTGDDGN